MSRADEDVAWVEPGQLIALIDSQLGGEVQRVPTTVTPELAQALLDRYTPARRPVQPRWVAAVADRIKHPDPEGTMFEEISVDPDGTTFAGQHLLLAVIEADTPVQAWVILNRRPVSLESTTLRPRKLENG